MIAVIVIMPVILARVIAFTIVRPGSVSRISVGIMPVSKIGSTISGSFMEPSRNMSARDIAGMSARVVAGISTRDVARTPARVVARMPRVTALCKRNTRSDKYQSSGDQQNFFD